MAKRLRLKSGSLTYVDVSSSKRICKKRVYLESRATVKPTAMPAEPVLQEFVSDEDIAQNGDDYGVQEDDDGGFSDMLVSNTQHMGLVEEDAKDEYVKRQTKACENWSAIREQLVHSVVESSFPDLRVCIECQEAAVCVCLECGPNAVYCSDHIEAFHDRVNIFHQPLIWKNGFLQLYTFERQRSLCNPSHSECPTLYSKKIVCVDAQGFQHEVLAAFCKCEPEAVTLVRYNMWPATPKNPTLALHRQLLEWLEALLLEGCISVDAFCRAIDIKRGNRISKHYRKLYPVLIDAFEEFRFNKHQVKTLGFLSPRLDFSSACPACPKDKVDIKILSMDAVFGLCRKKSAGNSVRPPLFAGLFFEEQATIDEFVANYDSSDQLIDKGCHQFLAGDALRSRSRYAALDETAVFGTVCRHNFPQKFISMKHGERLAYPVCLLERLLQLESSKLMIFYDIACLLEKHLTSRGRSDILDRTTLGVPIFHVYGHAAFCQITYSPRVLEGCGLTDGEGMERLWSYLRRFSKSTKEMRPSHRMDILTSALLHYGSRVSLSIGRTLCKRMKHSIEVQKSANDELSKLISTSNGTLSKSSIAEFNKEQSRLMSNEHINPSYGQRHKAFQDIVRIARERQFLLSTKARYGDGQSIATRISKKITSASKTLKRAINRFNSMHPDTLEGTSYALPSTITWESVRDLENLSLLEMTSNMPNTTTISFDMWLKALRANNMVKRSTEEKYLIIKEIKMVETRLKEQHAILLEYICQMNECQPIDKFRAGCICLLYERLLLCEASLQSFCEDVKEYHTVTFPNMKMVGQTGLLCTATYMDADLNDLNEGISSTSRDCTVMYSNSYSDHDTSSEDDTSCSDSD